MQRRIEKLTPEQIARFPEFIERWTKIGLSCEPLDLPRAQLAVRDAYAAAKLQPPKAFYVFDGPVSGAVGVAILRAIPSASVGASVGDSVWDSVWDSVGDSVRDSVGASVGDSVWESVWDSVWDSVRDSVRQMIYGSHDAGWLSFYSYFREAVGLKDQTEKLTGLLTLAEHCGWWSPYQEVAVLQHRHSELHRDDRGRLHNPNGMAVKYRDGWGCWRINGVAVDEQIVMRPESQTIKQIGDEQNAEVRRVRIERYGWTKYLQESGAKCLNQRKNEIENTREALFAGPGMRVMVVTCPTGRLFSLPVPEEVKSCEQAHNWLAGDRGLTSIGRT